MGLSETRRRTMSGLALLLALFVEGTRASYVVSTSYTGGVADGVITETYDSEGDMCSSFLMLPGQNLWPRKFAVVLYFFGLMWCFLGVAIVADLFMGAIEVITSKEIVKQRVLPSGEVEEVKFLVWNPTIANLSLMALGSSAPEILLAVIGAVQDLGTDNIDELGPGTIVGSAAFNLLFISAICVMAIPDGEGRFLGQVNVFYVTAVASVFAYLWMYFCLAVWTPDYVTVEEGVLTFLFFPGLLLLAYAADQGWCCGGGGGASTEDGAEKEVEFTGPMMGDSVVVAGAVKHNNITLNANREQLKDFVASLKKQNVESIEKTVLATATANDNKPKSKLQYRIAASRAMAGKKVNTIDPEKLQEEQAFVQNQVGDVENNPLHGQHPSMKALQLADGETVIEFKSTKYAVLESVGVLKVPLIRHGDLSKDVAVRVLTRDGTARADDQDYVHIDKDVVFAAGVAEVTVDVEIIDDDDYEPDEEFYLELHDTNMTKTKLESGDAALSGATQATYVGPRSVCTIEIIDDDNPGCLSFDLNMYNAIESEHAAKGKIMRRNGASGRISVRLSTVDESGFAGVNYEPVDEVIYLENEETEKEFVVPIINTSTEEDFEVLFKVKLSDPSEGVTLTSRRIATVRVTNDDELGNTLNKLQSIIEARAKLMSVSTSSWREQFEDALTISGEVDEVTGEETRPPPSAYILHFVSLFWKVLFAIVPPTSYWGGWAAFVVAVIMIGMLTAVIGELASLFGCALGLKEGVTAITFVALGTSLPDTFASAQAAVQEKTADAAVGNVTGSNAVNVFLGLGLPWLISSLYAVTHGSKNGYYLPAGDLSFSVIVFCCLAVTSLLIMLVRNFYFGGLLGGATWLKKPTAGLFVCFWLTYVILASMKAYGNI